MKSQLKTFSLYIAVLAGGAFLGYLVSQAPALFRADYIEGDFSAHFTDTQKHIVVYGAQWCPHCTQLREHLKANAIVYDWRDIDSSPTVLAQFEALEQKAIPIVIVGNKMMTGFDPVVLAKLVDELGVNPS